MNSDLALFEQFSAVADQSFLQEKKFIFNVLFQKRGDSLEDSM